MPNDELRVDSLQVFLKRIMRITGAVIGLGGSVMALACLYLVLHSAFSINHTIGVITLIVVAIAYIIAGLLSSSRFARFGYKMGSEHKLVTPALATSMLLFLCGFLQTLYWVIDYTNPMHEPRSVLILAVAGFIEYARQQYEKTQMRV